MSRKKRRSQKGKNKYTSQLVKKSRNEKRIKLNEKVVKQQNFSEDFEESENDL